VLVEGKMLGFSELLLVGLSLGESERGTMLVGCFVVFELGLMLCTFDGISEGLVVGISESDEVGLNVNW
jgi:hypothetical protein